MNKINGIKGKKIGKFRKKIRIPGILGAFGGRGRSLLEFRALPAPGKFPICAFYGKKKKKNQTRLGALRGPPRGGSSGAFPARNSSRERPRDPSRAGKPGIYRDSGGITGIRGEFIGIWGNYRDLGAPPPPPARFPRKKWPKFQRKAGKIPGNRRRVPPGIPRSRPPKSRDRDPRAAGIGNVPSKKRENGKKAERGGAQGGVFPKKPWNFGENEAAAARNSRFSVGNWDFCG